MVVTPSRKGSQDNVMLILVVWTLVSQELLLPAGKQRAAHERTPLQQSAQ